MPSPGTVLLWGPVGLLWAALCLGIAAHCKTRRGVATGYTRKLFHILIFGSVTVIECLFGTRHLCLFGGMTTLVILFAILRGDGHPLYEAMARENDAPHRTYFIVAPYFATLVGGLAANILFGPVAIVGYLVAGLGDAVGEPVGVRWGNHRYRVPSLMGVSTTRSIEGSAAVALVSALACLAGILLSASVDVPAGALMWIPIFGAICAGMEAISPHGWDNLAMQLVPTWIAHAWFGVSA
jgi:phytol kinase